MQSLGDVFRHRYNGKLVMVLKEDEDHDIHFLCENGESDYESIFNFQKLFESEGRNVKEYWETFVDSLHAVQTIDEPNANLRMYIPNSVQLDGSSVCCKIEVDDGESGGK